MVLSISAISNKKGGLSNLQMAVYLLTSPVSIPQLRLGFCRQRMTASSQGWSRQLKSSSSSKCSRAPLVDSQEFFLLRPPSILPLMAQLLYHPKAAFGMQSDRSFPSLPWAPVQPSCEIESQYWNHCCGLCEKTVACQESQSCPLSPFVSKAKGRLLVKWVQGCSRCV